MIYLPGLFMWLLAQNFKNCWNICAVGTFLLGWWDNSLCVTICLQDGQHERLWAKPTSRGGRLGTYPGMLGSHVNLSPNLWTQRLQRVPRWQMHACGRAVTWSDSPNWGHGHSVCPTNLLLMIKLPLTCSLYNKSTVEYVVLSVCSSLDYS